MSIKLMSLVWELDLPPGEKLVLLALADQANDHGVQCWPSVATIAHRSGQGERTVRRAISLLEEKKHLTRHHREGDSTQYHVHPCHSGTPAKSAPLPNPTGTPAKLAGKPSRTTKPKKGKPSLVAHEIPDDWQPSVFGETSQSRKVVDGWPPGELAYQLEQFRAHHRKKGERFKSWQDAWSTWVLNSRNFGATNGRTNGMGRHQPGDGLSATARAALAVFGPGAGDERPVPQ